MGFTSMDAKFHYVSMEVMKISWNWNFFCENEIFLWNFRVTHGLSIWQWHCWPHSSDVIQISWNISSASSRKIPRNLYFSPQNETINSQIGKLPIFCNGREKPLSQPLLFYDLWPFIEILISPIATKYLHTYLILLNIRFVAFQDSVQLSICFLDLCIQW